jgi:predicted  nucleic acid-binding Zn-ribbon protein
MAQRTEIDLKDLTDLIKGLDKKIDELGTKVESIEKTVTALDKQVGIGFSDINGKLDVINSRLTTAEAALVKLDTRLWAFGGVALSVTLGSLLTVFARYIFTDTPKF